MRPTPFRTTLVLSALACALAVSSCGSGLLGQEYEYEEELRLYVDGTARMDLNASVPALVALRGVDLDLGPDARIDRAKVRALFEGPGVDVVSVRESRRDGRQFVHLRIDVDDIRQLSRLAPFSWSTYQFDRRGELLEFKQAIGASAGKDVGTVGWDGSELVAFRMHLPSVIAYHNAPSRRTERGNILEWEQPLTERLKGTPIDVQVNMEPESILYSTLLLFGATIILAGVAFGIVIWRVMRHGRDDDAEPGRARTR
jgi:hypothetical protein